MIEMCVFYVLFIFKMPFWNVKKTTNFSPYLFYKEYTIEVHSLQTKFTYNFWNRQKKALKTCFKSTLLLI